jgi:cysteinyl-tRNA synthetase
MLELYNSLSRKKEKFRPINPEQVGLYSCGPTVYNFAHVGNLRTYIFIDTLKRALKANKYNVLHVMNITDVGHLTDDADNGEDKMEKGSKREGKTAREIADFYEQSFKNDIADLNILEPNIWCKATDHISEQIEFVQTLTNKGFTYETPDGIYFDTTKINDYGKLANLKKQNLKTGARVEIGYKKNPHDFALWKFSNDIKRQMEWNAFGKKGFPGWHIECSAMSIKYLGEHFDIHCGGVDHIPVHHTNEIAQSEAYLNSKPWVNYWMHGEFLILENDKKMAKSSENFITLSSIKKLGYSPLAYKYFILQAHYKKQLSFSFEALNASQTGFERLTSAVQKIDARIQTDPKLEIEFMNAINDDLNTPEALSIMWKALKENKLSTELAVSFDKVLGLKLRDIKETAVEINDEIKELLEQRAVARDEKDWKTSDKIRSIISKKGYNILDTDGGQKLEKNN